VIENALTPEVNPDFFFFFICFFHYRKVPGYMISQLLGALVGAALVYANYWRAIDIFEEGQRTLATASLFSTYAVRILMPFRPLVQV
jgi:aquaglyceroporin related protein